jgi:hypothetical protein
MSPVPFTRSTSGQCRWFVADAPSQPSSKRVQPVTGPRICGEPVKPGSSYCECHYARVYQVGTRIVMKPALDAGVQRRAAEAERTADLVELLG